MKEFTAYETWYGRSQPPPEIYHLRAGPFSVEFQDGDLRYLRLGGQGLIRRVYVAIRDVNWNTIPALVTDLVVDAAADHFRITYHAFHQDGPLRFRWHATLEGKPDGTIQCAMDGTAESDFRYCRIGFCVLHPIHGIAGRPYQAATPQGLASGQLPELVEPQQMDAKGFEAPIFPSCSNLTIDLENGVTLSTTFEGDLFEMEDQRNWTDGSFKTYCTPLSLGYPHTAKTGQVFHQKITITTQLPLALDQAEEDGQSTALALALGEATGNYLPKIGFTLPSRSADLDDRQATLIARLHPHHLKTEIHLKDPHWPAALKTAALAARQVGSTLELALFLQDESPAPLEQLREHLRGMRVAQLIVFQEAEAARETTAPRWMELARLHLAEILPGVPFVGGTNGNFAELNRQRPDIAAMDGVSYTINPQVHAFDERSLVEAIQAQRDTVLTARSFSGSLPVSISPVTLKPPFNVAANEEEGPADESKLPTAVDPRQSSLFAAAWTVGSLQSLASGGVDSITYYETTGWKGLMETAQGSLLPGQFSSFSGMVFPLYWVFSFLADARGAEILQVHSARPLLFNALAAQKGAHTWLLVVNYQPVDQPARLRSLPTGQAMALRLNQDTFQLAAGNPEAFLQQTAPLVIEQGSVELTLRPYETLMIKIERG